MKIREKETIKYCRNCRYLSIENTKEPCFSCISDKTARRPNWQPKENLCDEVKGESNPALTLLEKKEIMDRLKSLEKNLKELSIEKGAVVEKEPEIEKGTVVYAWDEIDDGVSVGYYEHQVSDGYYIFQNKLRFKGYVRYNISLTNPLIK